jgi:histidinol dehydrogenase
MSTTTTTLEATAAETTLSNATGGILQKITPSEVTLEIKDPVNPKALEQAKAILGEIVVGNTDNGRVNPTKLLEVAKRLRDVDADCTIDDLIVSKSACRKAYENLAPDEKTALNNMHYRIKTFAELQRASVKDTEMEIPGGKAGHTVSPCRGMLPTARSHKNDGKTMELP